MVAVWPPGLPTEPLAPSVKRKPDPRGRIVSQVDQGQAKVRRRGALRVKPIDVTYPIPREDYPTLEEFYETTLAEGTLPFDWPDPFALDTKRVRFRAGEQEPYDAALEGGGRYYLVTVKIELLP